MSEKSRHRIGGNRRLPLDGEYPREPDTHVLCQSVHGPYHLPPNSIPNPSTLLLKDDLDKDLWTAFTKMDSEESKKFIRFLSMLSSLSPEEIERIYKIVKVFGFLRWLLGGIKWMAVFFGGGLAATVAAGDQLQKIIGWMRSIFQFFKAHAS